MKNITVDVDNLLIIISFALLIAIFFNLLYGCSYRKPREFFDNKETKDEKEDAKDDKVKSKKSKESFEDKPKESSVPSVSQVPPVQLSKFEQEIKEGLENGTLKENDIMELIKAEKFTQVNVDNLQKAIAAKMSA